MSRSKRLISVLGLRAPGDVPDASACGPICQELGRHVGTCDHAAREDPFPVSALLAAAVTLALTRSGIDSISDVAKAAGLSRKVLHAALRQDHETQPRVVRAILRVAGLRLEAVPVE